MRFGTSVRMFNKLQEIFTANTTGFYCQFNGCQQLCAPHFLIQLIGQDPHPLPKLGDGDAPTPSDKAPLTDLNPTRSDAGHRAFCGERQKTLEHVHSGHWTCRFPEISDGRPNSVPLDRCSLALAANVEVTV